MIILQLPAPLFDTRRPDAPESAYRFLTQHTVSVWGPDDTRMKFRCANEATFADRSLRVPALGPGRRFGTVAARDVVQKGVWISSHRVKVSDDLWEPLLTNATVQPTTRGVVQLNSVVDFLLQMRLRRKLWHPSKGAPDLVTHVAAADSECAVCLASIKKGDDAATCEDNDHAFHGTCLQEWVDRRGWDATCPSCRGSLPLGDAE